MTIAIIIIVFMIIASTIVNSYFHYITYVYIYICIYVYLCIHLYIALRTPLAFGIGRGALLRGGPLPAVLLRPRI